MRKVTDASAPSFSLRLMHVSRPEVRVTCRARHGGTWCDCEEPRARLSNSLSRFDTVPTCLSSRSGWSRRVDIPDSFIFSVSNTHCNEPKHEGGFTFCTLDTMEKNQQEASQTTAIDDFAQTVVRRRPNTAVAVTAFAGRLGGNQEFIADHDSDSDKSLLQKQPDAVSCNAPFLYLTNRLTWDRLRWTVSGHLCISKASCFLTYGDWR